MTDLIDFSGPATICPGCGQIDPDIELIDFGIGPYEFWGANGYHSDEHLVTRCCETQPEQFWPEPSDDEIPEDQVGALEAETDSRGVNTH